MPFLAWKQADQLLSVIGKRQLGIGMWTRDDALPAAVLHDLSIEAAILTMLALVAALANRELSTPEWDLEWLVKLPIPGPALFAIRVLERTLVNPLGFILIGAFTSAIAWRSGFGAAIPLVAAAATVALLLIVAAAWTVGDTALRLALAPPKLRNIQALLSVAGVLMMIVAVAPVTGVLGPIDYVGAKLWASISLIYPIAILTASYLHGGFDWRAAALGAIAIAGVPIYATIATALSVFASDPLAPTTQRRLRLGYTYLYMGLAGLFTYALYADDPWQKGVLVVLASLLALALWQKARDQLPFLLDPTAAPGARVSVADGMIAAVLFFVTQGVAVTAIATAGDNNFGLVIIKAFVWAGAVTFAVMRFAFWRTHAGGVPRLLGVGVPRAIGAGLVGALVASLAGVPYLIILRRFGLLPPIPPEALAAARSWLIPLAVVAAPIFEEFIFRGLIFGGLRRTFGGWSSALASAGIFAIVHPHLSVVPVFVMGVVAARVYDRAGMLLAPMLVHAGYNAAVTWLQPLLAR